ncbi:alpha/beta hydrolase [Candidatus Woesearchaeota archaeon]|nr:alpha/beta hydrolase [Candidatus Woesearchaeota archaeon]
MKYNNLGMFILGSSLALGLGSDTNINNNSDTTWADKSHNCDRPQKDSALSKLKKNITKRVVRFGLEEKIERGTETLIYPPSKTPGHKKIDFNGTPNDFGLAYSDLTFKTKDGLKLDGWYVPGKNSKGIILCHGNGGSKVHMRKHAKFLNDSGYNVVMFDFRGQGESEGRYVTYGVLEVKDVDAAVVEFTKRGINDIGILGTSLGGGVAIIAAAQNQEIDAVVADAAYSSSNAVAVHTARKYGIPDEIREEVIDSIFDRAREITGVDYGLANPVSYIDRISPRPILLIHGKKDTIVPVSQARFNFSRAGEPKTLWIRRNGKHDNYIWQKYGAEYERRVIDFFNQNL